MSAAKKLTLRQRGKRAARLAIAEMIHAGREASRPYAKRYGYSVSWWRGYYHAAVCAEAHLALEDFPQANKTIIERLERDRAVRAAHPALQERKEGV